MELIQLHNRSFEGLGKSAAEVGEALERAMTYPYPRAEGSFFIQFSKEDTKHSITPIDPTQMRVSRSRWRHKLGADDGIDLYDIQVKTVDGTSVTREAVYPVLAIAANASPQVLEKIFGKNSKRGPFEGSSTMVVTRCKIKDYSVVSAACISSSGSIPATLDHDPGVETEVAITWLNKTQLERMNLTEPNYSLDQLQDTVAELENGTTVSMPLAYICARGVFVPGTDSKPVALKEIKSTTSYPKVSQLEVQHAARQSLELEAETLESFMATHALKKEQRLARRDVLTSGFSRETGGKRRTWLPPGTQLVDEPATVAAP